jgi:hypothetical protein
MITEMIKILNLEAQGLVEDIRKNLALTGTNASSETSDSVEYDLTHSGLSKYKILIQGRPYFMTVETGRKPTPDKKPSREMVDNLAKWLRSVGKNESMKWAVATEINKHGTKLWQKGGRKDIVSNVLSESNLDNIARRLLEDFGDQFLTESANIFNNKK